MTLSAGEQAGITVPQIVADLFTARFAGQPAWAVLTEVFIGLGWLRAGVSKVIDPSWQSGNYLTGFLIDHQDDTVGWYSPFVDTFVSGNTQTVSAIVLVMQFVVAASLLTGQVRSIGLGLGIGMNLHFLAAGSVDPSAFYLLAQIALVFLLLDRWPAHERRVLLPSVASAGLATAALNLPFVRTVHPAEVIRDPAIMFATLGSLVCLACIVSLADSAEPAESNDGQLESNRDGASV